MSRRWKICLHIIYLAFGTTYLYQKTFSKMNHQYLRPILKKGCTHYNLKFDWREKAFSNMDRQHLRPIFMKGSTHYNLQFDCEKTFLNMNKQHLRSILMKVSTLFWCEKIFSKMKHQYLRSILMKGSTLWLIWEDIFKDEPSIFAANFDEKMYVL